MWVVGVVKTIVGKCKRCYSCIRNCPAKAIAIEEGQSKVIDERCIGCGLCTRVCVQNAKAVQDGKEPFLRLRTLLRAFSREGNGAPQTRKALLACLAPSFPAAFPELDPGLVVSGLRALGISHVYEVSIGAQLVTKEYKSFLANAGGRAVISSACPAVVNLIEKHYTSLLPCLAPIVSPMIALGRLLRQEFGGRCGIVFIGPCIAKKDEINHPLISGAIDVVLTFAELKELWASEGIDPKTMRGMSFDARDESRASAFPISGGLSWAAGLGGRVVADDIIVAEGHVDLLNAIQDLAEGRIKARFLDLLACEGCIDGPGIPNDLSLFARKQVVSEYVKSKGCGGQIEVASDNEIDLSRTFQARPAMYAKPSEEELKGILRSMGKSSPEDELNCGACGYNSCRDKAIAIFNNLAEEDMCLPGAIQRLEEARDNITKKSKILSRLFELSTAVETVRNPEEIMRAVLEGIVNSLGFDAATVLWIDRKAKCLRRRMRFPPAENSQGMTIPLYSSTSTLVRAIFETGHFLRSPKTEGPDPPLDRSEVESFGRSYVVIPLGGRYSRKCYEALRCPINGCSARENGQVPCWRVPFTRCSGRPQSSHREKVDACLGCEVFNVFGVVVAENRNLNELIAQGQLLSAMTLVGEAGLAVERAHLDARLNELTEKLQERAHKTAEDLKRTKAKLTMAKKLATVGQLAAEVAHEIKAPISVISSLAESLLEGPMYESPIDSAKGHGKEEVVLIKAAAERAWAILNNLLELSRPREVKLEPGSINDLIEYALEFMNHRMQRNGIEVKRDLYPGLPVIPVDKELVCQAFINIIANAVEAMPNGGTLTVMTGFAENGSSIYVGFADTGCGIATEHLDRIFEPFFTTKGGGAGSGLGLSITYDIVERHGGDIEVISKPNKGSVFQVKLPLEMPKEGESGGGHQTLNRG